MSDDLDFEDRQARTAVRSALDALRGATPNNPDVAEQIAEAERTLRAALAAFRVHAQ